MQCLADEWFSGEVDRCDDRRYIRTDSNHCTEYVTRDPGGVRAVDGDRDLRGTDDDFDACTSADNIRSYMDWENCIQLEQVQCSFASIGMPCSEGVDMLNERIPWGNSEVDGFDPSDICSNECDLRGFYYDEGMSFKRFRRYVFDAILVCL